MQVLLQFREFSSLYFWYPNQCLVHIRLLKINLLNKTKLKETEISLDISMAVFVKTGWIMQQEATPLSLGC